MMTGTAIVALIASAGWLILNIRSLQSQGLSWSQQAAMLLAWIVLFGAVAVLFTRAGA